MHKIYIVSVSLFLLFTHTLKADCETVYSNVTYGLSHAKKALAANNFDHQVYYAEKGLLAYEKVLAELDGCDCEGISEKVEDIIGSFDAAVNASKWDTGRYHSKKAYNDIQELITVLDIFMADAPSENEENQTDPNQKNKTEHRK